MVGFGWWLCWALGLFTVVREKGGRETLMRERERERERERDINVFNVLYRNIKVEMLGVL